MGCKVYFKRNDASGQIEERLAEILSIRDKSVLLDARLNEAGDFDSSPENKVEFFVHWDHFNKRLDEWVSGSRIVFTRDLELPVPKISSTKKAAPGKKLHPPGKVPKASSMPKFITSQSEAAAPSPSPATPSPAPSTSGMLKRKAPHDEVYALDDDGEEEDAEGEMDVDEDLTNPPPKNPTRLVSTTNKDQDIKKPRTSGSLGQSISEVSRVKNLNRLQIGKYEVEAWYFSPYPMEYAHLDVLYICEFCLSYFPSATMLKRHRSRCTLFHPPGNEIYRDEDISFWEIDGRKQVTYCRNLSLLSKCFLDQ